MELIKFLEQDMMSFLDLEVQMRKSHISRIREEEFQIFDLNRDYSKEVTEALEVDNVNKAQKTLREVKQLYNKIAENTEAKKKAYSILEELYNKTKEYIQAQEGASNLADEIKDLEKVGLFGTAAPESILTQAKQRTVVQEPSLPVEAEKPTRARFLAEQPVININIYGDAGKDKSFFSDEKKLEGEEDYLRKKVKEEIGRLGEMLNSKERLPVFSKKGKVPEPWKKGEKKTGERRPENRINEKKSEEMSEEERKLIESRRGINRGLESLYNALRSKDVGKAKQEYMALKKFIDVFPFKDQEEKEGILTDMVALRDQIRNLENYQREKEEVKKERKKEEVKNEIEARKLKEVNEIIKDVERCVKEKQLHRVNFLYLEAKHQLEKIKDKKSKSDIIERLEKLRHKVLLQKISEKVKEDVAPLKKEISELKKKRKMPKELDPSREMYKQGLKELYHGSKDEAAKLFKKALEINPDYVAARIRLKQASGEA
ncbi:MAG: hypothetical protein ABIE94_05145 [archaeon]